MKVLLITVALVALAVCEPPPSKSYLPPPPGRSTGYPEGPQSGPAFNPAVPEVVAARSVDVHGQDRNGNGFASPQDHGSHGRFGNNGNGYDKSGTIFGRNAVEDGDETASYNYGYMVSDYQEGTEFGHHEERLEGTAHGQYHVLLPNGRRQTVSYEADGRGFKPRVSYQDSEDLTRSGYDSNASNVRSGGSHDNGFETSRGSHASHGKRNGY